MSELREWVAFRPREAPDAAEHVRRAITVGAYDHVARVRIEAPKSVVEQRLSNTY